MTGRSPHTFPVIPYEGTRRSYTPYMVHLPNTTFLYDNKSYFWISSPSPTKGRGLAKCDIM